MVVALKKVLISDEVDPKCVEVLQANGIEVVKNTKLSKEELLAEIPKYDGLIVRSATKVTADVINAGTSLKIIGRAGTGVDNIDCKAATQRGIIVMNTPGGNTLSAAEHTCALIISLTRDLARAAQSMKEGRWDRKAFMGIELNGKTLAIIGLGRIGREVALRMQSFGMTTIGFDPIIGADVAAEFNTEWLPLEEIWPRADFITVHTPLIPATTNLLNDAVFAKCKKGVRVVNCARGGIIEEAALLRALESGQCGGAGLDVFCEEPPKDQSLVQHPKVTATPHLGASTKEAQSRVAVEIAEQFVDLAQGKKLFGAINAPALSNALSPATQPWVKLGESLGVLAALLAPASPSSFQLQTTGSDLSKAGSYLSAALMSGYLRSTKAAAGTCLNLVNAPVLAKEAGLQVTTSSEAGAVPGVGVRVSTSGGDLQLAGSVAAGVPVLTSVQGCGFSVPASLQGPVLVFKASPSPALLPSVIESVGKSGGTVVGLSVSGTANSTVYGIVNLSAALGNGLEALKAVVTTASQASL
ncbi:D-3-phosphoglycerate dehydrogenase-like [Babylonia areolata]|uniref:D-3-phosphoglycerate dehydrogenase-like n=1 Tax=Babylonia areolata TaxID=304850 RepID=UPI003FD681B4